MAEQKDLLVELGRLFIQAGQLLVAPLERCQALGRTFTKGKHLGQG